MTTSQTQYAINIADLTYPDMILGAQIMIAPVKGAQVDAEHERFDGMAIRLECNTERAEAIIAVLRIKRPLTRAYVSTTGKGWKRYKP